MTVRRMVMLLVIMTGTLLPSGRLTAQEPDEVRARWDRMSPEERRVVTESFERWKQLDPDEREMMKRRHERLERERQHAAEILPDTERTRLDQLDDVEMRRELTDKAQAMVRGRFERLPPALRARLKEELSKASPSERNRRLHVLLEQEMAIRIADAMRRMVERGLLSQADFEGFKRQSLEAKPAARFDILRRFILDHLEAFRVDPEAVSSLRDAPATSNAEKIFELLHKMHPLRPPKDASPKPEKQGDGAPRSEGGVHHRR